MARPFPRALGYVVAWVVAAAAAVTVGLVAVTGVGASVRDRGPLTGGAQAVRDARTDGEGDLVADPGAAAVEDTVTGDYGSFTVTCQGAVATAVRPEPAAGWRVVSYEAGPDDDVDAVLAAGARSVEVEVFCNGGRPTVSDLEEKTLDADD
ncbi:hypothetical protein [Nocardioides litoris]|uniref:hypothetical protein n=1 Tax=Nocardioides litoris TaxID=1926648 RepID=UPI001120E00D|nr:hypothetical protein [Nocardioides litoris]